MQEIRGHIPQGDARAAKIDQLLATRPNAPGTITGNVADISAGGNAQPSAGLQYSRGYQGPNDVPRDSGNFFNRMLTSAGRSLNQPSNFLPSPSFLLGPPGMAYAGIKDAINQYQQRNAPQQDPAAIAGATLPAILASVVTHSGDADLSMGDTRVPANISRGAQVAGKVVKGGIQDLPFIKQLTKVGKYWDETAPQYPGAPLPANPVEPVLANTAKRQLVGNLKDEANRLSQLENPQYPGAPLPSAPESVPVKTKIGGRLVLTPEEEQQAAQIQRIAKKRASERGMQYAAGMKPSGGKVNTP